MVRRSTNINLITGGAGFLGSHLTDKLISIGEEVICLDNFFTGTKKNIQKWIGHPRFELIRHDVVEPIYLEVDRIWHLACPASPYHYLKDPIRTSRIIFCGTHNLLELAKRQNARFLFASSSEIYGESTTHPQVEDDNGSVCSIGKRSCYREGKRFAESLCFDYHRTFLTDIRIARIFNTYGPNMHPNDGRVVSNFIVQALTNQDITVYGNGDQTRSFCYIDDLISGIFKMMSSEEKFIGPVNLGNPVEFKIIDLAKTIIKLTNSKSNIVNKELPTDDPIRRKPNISLAKNFLDWEPSFNLEEGLKLTIDYFKSQIK